MATNSIPTNKFAAVEPVWGDKPPRKMVNQFHGVEFYRSEFDPSSGLIVRALPKFQQVGSSIWSRHSNYDGVLQQLFKQAFGSSAWRQYGPARQEGLGDEWEKKYHWRDDSFSPVPETVDVQLTNWCDYGCPYCYQSSTKRDGHANPQLITDIITGFDQPPYQIAYGGGEPTAHPEFVEILRKTTELGSVPNYTTAGHRLTDNILEATQRYCGGVALTYHHWKGVKPFKAALTQLAELRCQINIHVIADSDVVESLTAVSTVCDDVFGGSGWSQYRDGSIVLLAYYPQGRGTLDGLMDKQTYMHRLPAKLNELAGEHVRVAYSEGLLPYFLSRPHLPVNTTMAERGEGLFSCYIDRNGLMSKSSFHGGLTGPSIYKQRPQTIWNTQLGSHHYGSGAACDRCSMADRCTIPNMHHYFICAYADHNK